MTIQSVDAKRLTNEEHALLRVLLVFNGHDPEGPPY